MNKWLLIALFIFIPAALAGLYQSGRLNGKAACEKSYLEQSRRVSEKANKARAIVRDTDWSYWLRD